MSRRAKGPRLYLRSGRTHPRSGKPIPDVYYIRDGSTEVSTGCGPDRLGDAEKALAGYIATKWTPGPAEPDVDPSAPRDPSRVYIAEVLALYLREKAPKAPDPSAVAARIKALLAWWGEKRVSDIRRSTCEAYVAHRCAQPIATAKGKTPRLVTAQGARRELEDLSAAITYFHGEHPLTVRPKVSLPEKPESPRDALTRSQAAALLWAAMGWRRVDAYGPPQRGQPWPTGWKRIAGSSRKNRAHLRRFILIGLYTGTRPGVIPKLLWEESPTQAWVDLTTGTVYRRGKLEREHRTKRRPLVRVPGRLLAHMRRWRELDRKLMEKRGKAQLPTTNTVLHHGGQPIAGRIRRGFAGCVADAGLAEEITPHWMRHTSATWLMERGADPWEASGYLGMNVKTLLDNYGHHRPDHQGAARRAIGR